MRASAVIVPCGLKDSVRGLVPTSWMPELVNTEIWLWSFSTTRMSISCES